MVKDLGSSMYNQKGKGLDISDISGVIGETADKSGKIGEILIGNDFSPIVKDLTKNINLEQIWLKDFEDINVAYEGGNKKYIIEAANKDVDGLLDMLNKNTSEFLVYMVSIKQKSALSNNYKTYLNLVLDLFNKRLQSDISGITNYKILLGSTGRLVSYVLGNPHHEKYLELLNSKKRKAINGDLSKEHISRQLSDEEIIKLELDYIVAVLDNRNYTDKTSN